MLFTKSGKISTTVADWLDADFLYLAFLALGDISQPPFLLTGFWGPVTILWPMDVCRQMVAPFRTSNITSHTIFWSTLFPSSVDGS